jgi:hypothetical protein
MVGLRSRYCTITAGEQARNGSGGDVTISCRNVLAVLTVAAAGGMQRQWCLVVSARRPTAAIARTRSIAHALTVLV